MPRVGEVVVDVKVRVSVTRNESPGCRRDRCQTGLEFAVRDLPERCWGRRFFRRFDGRTLTLSTEGGEGFSRTAVTVRGGYTKMTVAEGTPHAVTRQPPTTCSGKMEVRDGQVTLSVVVCPRVKKRRRTCQK